MNVMSDSSIKEMSARNSERAWDIIRRTGIMETWTRHGAEVNVVGSLSMGLLMNHLDIDMHIYSSPLNLKTSFAAMADIAGCQGIKRIECRNLTDTDEACVEWHAWYDDEYGDTWQIDMINIEKGSRYDGYFERMAERIKVALTDETRLAILRLKHDTPADEHITGMEYYQAVIRDGIRSMDEFRQWRSRHPVTGIIEWMP